METKRPGGYNKIFADAYEAIRNSPRLDEATSHGIFVSPLSIRNVVVVCMGTEGEFDLSAYAAQFAGHGAHTNPKDFPNMGIAYIKPRCTDLLFSTSKMNAEGCKYLVAGVLHLRRLARDSRRLSDAPRDPRIPTFAKRAKHIHPFQCKRMSIQNLVAGADMGYMIDIYQILEENGAWAKWSPKFPGLILRERPEQGNITVSIFESGAVILTGRATVCDARKVIHWLRRFLVRYCKQPIERMPPLREREVPLPPWFWESAPVVSRRRRERGSVADFGAFMAAIEEEDGDEVTIQAYPPWSDTVESLLLLRAEQVDDERRAHFVLLCLLFEQYCSLERDRARDDYRRAIGANSARMLGDRASVRYSFA